MPVWLKRIAKTFAIILLVFLIAWVALAVYISVNKKQILISLTEELNQNLNGKLTINSMEPALIQGFPGISVSLNQVLLRDSLYDIHKHDLLRAEHVYAAVNVISLLRRNPQINNISISNGRIYLYTDSLGRSNADIIRKKPGEKGTASNKRNRFNKISLENVDFVYENQIKHKLYKFFFDDFSSKINYKTDSWNAKVDINAKVGSLAFNTENGSFIKDQTLRTNLSFSYDHNKHLLTIPATDFKIGEDHFKIGGDFAFAPNNSAFHLQVVSENIMYRNATALLTQNITPKLNRYDLDKPLYVEAKISGELKSKGDPQVIAKWNTKNNTIHFMGTKIRKASFSGQYTNQ